MKNIRKNTGMHITPNKTSRTFTPTLLLFYHTSFTQFPQKKCYPNQRTAFCSM
jgi:hypothetical protein